MRFIRRFIVMLRDLRLSVKLLLPLVIILTAVIVNARLDDAGKDSSSAFHRGESSAQTDSKYAEATSPGGSPVSEGGPSSAAGSGSPSSDQGPRDRRSASSLSTGGSARAGGAISNPARDRIAFVEDGEIYVMYLDGSGKTRLGPGSDPDWSPDGAEILFTLGGTGGGCAVPVRTANSPDPCDIWVMSADGSNRRLLGSGLQPDWSPDGRRIAYVWGQGDTEIYVMSADGSGSVQLTQTPERAHSPDWSPDGSRIAFSRRESCGDACWTVHIYVMNASGSGLKSLGSQVGEGDAAWSPDGARIAFSGTPGNQGDNGEIFTMDSDGSDLRRLTHDTRGASPMDNFDGLPAWSPDGRIIFTRDTDGPTGWASCYYFYGQPNCGTGGPAAPEIFLMNADGSGRVRIGAGFGATFAPRRR